VLSLVPELYDRTYVPGGWGGGLLRCAAEMASMVATTPSN
jgi:hypothetical protein